MASTSMRAFRAVVLLSVWVPFFAVSIEAKEQKANSFQKLLPGPVGNSDYYDGGHPSPAKVELGRMVMRTSAGNR